MQAVDVWVVKPRDKQRPPAVQISAASRYNIRHTDCCVVCFGVLMLLISSGDVAGQLVMCFIPASGKQAIYGTNGNSTHLNNHHAVAAYLKVCAGW